METVYSIHQLKTHLSRLIKEVDRGQTLVFGARGEPTYVIKKYIPLHNRQKSFGSAKEQYDPSKASVEALPDQLIDTFYDSTLDPH